ncbi:MAG: AMP-binding protein [Acidobacteria bacterium]|nr:AMP-binding protein [Acidobacteriota bacterium]
MDTQLSPTEIFNNRKVFLLGSTGFLGKVCLCMLLYRFPNIARIYVMVRAGSDADSAARFWDIVNSSPVFDLLRERYGNAMEGFLREKVIIVGGDIGEPNLGYSEDFAQMLATDVDVIINSSGNVTFNPALDAALRTNVIGTQNVVAFAKRMKRPALVHVSTCFVAGNRSGSVWEDDKVIGYFPRHQEIQADFSFDKELRDCDAIKKRVQEESTDVVINARFREDARQRLIDEGRDPDDERSLQTAILRERKVWIRERLTDLGAERAKWWGWPNIYTYTKSLGEQVVAVEKDIAWAIVRPSIVESAEAFPFPGWNEGFTTTAPLIFLALKGQTKFPAENKLILDIIPVDHIASAVLGTAVQVCVEKSQQVFQLASGDSNPNRMERIVTLLGLYKRKYFQDKETGNKWFNEIIARLEARTVTTEHFNRTSLPMYNKAAKKVSSWLDNIRPRWGGGKVTQFIDQVKESVDKVEKFTSETKEAFDLFRPFTNENQYVFRCDNTRKLMGRISPDEQHLLSWTPAQIDWYRYWMEIHIPGLEKWVFPTFEEDLEEKPKRVYTYRDLIELFETTTKRHARRVAMRIERDGVEERYTYAEVRELATRAGAFLVSQNVLPGERIMLLAENCPEWGMCYFGALKAGVVCIPVDSKSTVDEVVNISRSGTPIGIITSDDLLLNKFLELQDRLVVAGLSTRIWTFNQIFKLTDEESEEKNIAKLPSRISTNAMASLIFTSGTTGLPKGVMLSHKNFTSLVSKLSSVFDLNEHDGMLSVLPLHHTFEFSAGFLVPLSVGAQITYLPELTGDALSDTLKKQHVSAIVGVPALWELLHRRIMNKFSDKSIWLERTVKAMMELNSKLRDKTPINLGPIVFYPVHKGLGGNIRYLISGGSALSENVLKGFHGLGFTLLEGYGLTEASPVITVTRRSNKMLPGSVGKALPGVDLMIINPDDRGVGEVVARGPNVMLGYYNNEAATKSVLVDKWLHTGDLGHINEDGNLYLMGRSKDIIVDNNGKNIYPDEIEELYGNYEFIKELSVVGLPDGSAERVACLAVPDYERDKNLSRDDVRARIEEHFRQISNPLPFHKRVKTLQFTDIELPRTATRKVKRREVIDILIRLQKAVKAASSAREIGADDELGWLFDVVASVSNKHRGLINIHTKLAELGFDSLMYTELGVAIEAAGGTFPSADALAGITDMRELAAMVKRNQLAHRSEAKKDKDDEKEDEIYIPPAVAEIGGKLIDLGQVLLYEKIFDSKFKGRSHIPLHTNFIVAPNHCSHLDMGLTKVALGEAGKELVALGAADYFFDNKYKRAYFENFTNVVPLDRSGSLRKSLRWAGHFLMQGYNMLIFPEGTRSISGEMQDFKPTLGYLAINHKIGILPMYLGGTYESLPKGTVIPKKRNLEAIIGPFVSYEDLEKLIVGFPKSEAYRLIAFTIKRMVEKMRDGQNCYLNIEKAREEWKHESDKTEFVEQTM